MNTILERPLSLQCKLTANYIIEEINKYNENKPLKEKLLLSCKKLQKILYFCNIEYMKKHMGEPLFNDEFHAWPSGPAIPYVYYTYTPYYKEKIEPDYKELHKNMQTLSPEAIDIINEVLDATKELDTIDLDEFAKIPGSPWAHAYNLDDPDHRQIISKDEMYDFYAKKEHSIIHKGPSLIRKKL